MLTALGQYDEPLGHGEVTLSGVRLPATAILAGPGRAFEIAQGRLGPGRVHHCMRLIGLAEMALELACERSTSRVAFGKPIANLGGNRERLARARIAINQARLLVLHAAWKLDTVGIDGAQSEVSEIKAAVPQMACDVIDLAIQLHGGGGMSEDFPLAAAYAGARSLRLADGPDEVHLGVVARHLLRPYSARAAAAAGRRRTGNHPHPDPGERPMSRRVLVTGGASGLGLALTELMVARGDTVLVVDLAEERPDTVPEGAAYRRLDVRSQQDWDAALAWVRETWGGLDMLVNNAGVATGGRIDVEAISDWERVVDINLLGVARGCHTFTPLFKEQRSGHIVNVASLAGLVHGPGMASYNATKAGVVAVSETLSFELGPWDIDVSVICPAFFRTNLHRSFAGKDAAMQEAGMRLITQAKVDAKHIAAIALKGIDKRKKVILTDRLGHQAYLSKRFARPALRPDAHRAGQAPRPSCRRRPGRLRAVSTVAGAAPVREEDAFDVERVANWLRENAPGEVGVDGIPEVQQFVGGASNLTYLLRYGGGPDAGGRDLILRRPPTGTKARGAHDMRREHDIQAALAPVFPAVPRMVAFCGDDDVIGSQFYVMERLEGTILRRDVPPELGLDRDGVAALCRTAIDTLVALHDVDVEAAGLAELDRGDGYVRRQVEGWCGRYRRARTDDVGDFEATMAWIEAHEPADRPHVLIHNDFRFDNLVLDPADPTRIVGVLDWEMATVGDPLMDLGAALAYWVQADDHPAFLAVRRQPTHTPGMLTRAEVVERYSAARGLEVTPEQWRFYDVFGAFRLAVIAQQIYYRFHHGQTSNPAYGEFRDVVRFLDQHCAALIAAP